MSRAAGHRHTLGLAGERERGRRWGPPERDGDLPKAAEDREPRPPAHVQAPWAPSPARRVLAPALSPRSAPSRGGPGPPTPGRPRARPSPRCSRAEGLCVPEPLPSGKRGSREAAGARELRAARLEPGTLGSSARPRGSGPDVGAAAGGAGGEHGSAPPPPPRPRAEARCPVWQPRARPRTGDASSVAAAGLRRKRSPAAPVAQRALAAGSDPGRGRQAPGRARGPSLGSVGRRPAGRGRGRGTSSAESELRPNLPRNQEQPRSSARLLFLYQHLGRALGTARRAPGRPL